MATVTVASLASKMKMAPVRHGGGRRCLGINGTPKKNQRKASLPPSCHGPSSGPALWISSPLASLKSWGEMSCLVRFKRKKIFKKKRKKKSYKMQPNIHCLKKEVIGTHVRADPWSLQPTPSALAEIVVGWRTLLEKCGDALLDDRSKQLPFYFAIWRFDGEMWAQRPGRGVGAMWRGVLKRGGGGGCIWSELGCTERFSGGPHQSWNSELGTAAASSRCSRGHSPVLLCLPNHHNSFPRLRPS